MVRRLVESGILLALGFVLSFIKIKLPFGSITLFSMVPIVILTYKYGMAWGFLCGFVHGVLQIIEGGFSAPPVQNALYYILCFLLDYALAWAVIGLAGCFRNITKYPVINITLCGAVGVFFRFLSSFASGVLIWNVYAEGENIFKYSFVVNISSLGPEIIITAVGAGVLASIPVIRKQLKQYGLKHPKANQQ